MTAQIFQLFNGGVGEKADQLQPLGKLLLERQEVTEAQLDAALQIQQRSKAELGEILVSHGWASPNAVAKALAEQYGLGFADLEQDQPEAIPADVEQIDVLLKHRILPWRRIGRVPSYVTANPALAGAALDDLAPHNGMAFFAVADQRSIDSAALRLFGEPLATRAAERTPQDQSVRSLGMARWL